MKRKGFTLIELLAVIVILAVIAIVATPIIVGIIEDSKKSAFERSVEGIMHAIDLEFETQESLTNFTYEIENGEVKNTTLKTPIKNLEGFNGIIKYDEKGNSTYAVNDGIWCSVKTSDGQIKTKAYNGTCSFPKNLYIDGEVVYYDVLNGETCTNYHEDNSLTGYNGVTTTTENQTSCLKFYAFNDEESNSKVSLLLDHNTTASVAWNSTGSNTTGPKTPEESTTELLGKLKEDTKLWIGTEIPSNYAFVGAAAHYAHYVLDYSDYRARIITVEELEEITDYDHHVFRKSYFDSRNGNPSSLCTLGNTTGCQYGWLYDRTSTACEDYGCFNNSDLNGNSYWTASSSPTDNYYATYIDYNAFSSSKDVDETLGLRPVIEVLKSNL